MPDLGPRRDKTASTAPRLRLVGNRDWIIPVDCTAEGVVVRPLGQSFPVESLTAPAGTETAFLQAIRQLIARRQASVRPGDPPYRPQVRFLIHKDALRTYYLAYPDLRPLQILLTRQNADKDDEDR